MPAATATATLLLLAAAHLTSNQTRTAPRTTMFTSQPRQKGRRDTCAKTSAATLAYIFFLLFLTAAVAGNRQPQVRPPQVLPQVEEQETKDEQQKTAMRNQVAHSGELHVKIERVGRARTPVAILDNVLTPNDYFSLRKRLRGRADYFEGHANGVNFPGKTAVLDRATVDPLVDALLSSSIVHAHFPSKIFEQRDFISGFASVLCNPWGLKRGVHHDFAGSRHEEVNAPAAVFYFGFDGAEDGLTADTGTAFYREKSSGLERASSIAGNKTKFCQEFASSTLCPKLPQGGKGREDKGEDDDDDDLFEEMYRVVGAPNRLIVYPQDLLHKAWVLHSGSDQDGTDGKEDVSLPCSPTNGRLAISLFFLMPQGEGTGIVDRLQDIWKARATKTLRGDGPLDLEYSAHDLESPQNGGYQPPPAPSKQALSNPCEIDAVEATELGPSIFLNEYYGKKPVLIRGAVLHWAAQTKWTKSFMKAVGLDTAAPTLEHFLNRLSDNVVPANDDSASGNNKEDAGNGEEDSGNKKEDLGSGQEDARRRDDGGNARDAIERRLNARAHQLAGVNTSHTNYLFRRLHRGRLSHRARSMDEDVVHAGSPNLNFATFNVLRDVSVPPYFYSPWNISSTSTSRSGSGSLDYFLSFGKQDTGLSFHEHSDAWNGLIWGRKRWFLVPKGISTTTDVKEYDEYIDRVGREKWLRQIYPGLSKDARPRQCWQEKGDLMYVPNGTIHAVWNEGEVMAVSSLHHEDEDLSRRGYKPIVVEEEDNGDFSDEDDESAWRSLVMAMPHHRRLIEEPTEFDELELCSFSEETSGSYEVDGEPCQLYLSIQVAGEMTVEASAASAALRPLLEVRAIRGPPENNALGSKRHFKVGSGDKLTLRYLQFSSGRVCGDNSDHCRGGVIFVDGGAEVVIQGCEFVPWPKDTGQDYEARDGGFILASGSGTVLTIEDSTFVGGRASQGGGALYLRSQSVTTIRRTVFARCQSVSGSGGAISLHGHDTKMYVFDSTFESNTAQKGGGAVFVYGDHETDPNVAEFSSTKFVENVAKTVGGGAIAVDRRTWLEYN